MNKKIIIILFVVFLTIAAMVIAMPDKLIAVLGGTAKITIVVDPGHGGIDGGAQSKAGVCEKNINLNICLKIKELAEQEGWRVLMTRDKDEGLYSEEKGSIRSKKNEDLNARQKIINGSGADAAISIHLNSYPSQQAKGAQTFYSKKSDEGKEIAEKIQEKIKDELDSENDRTPLSKDDILIMKNNTVPLVLVECGFLSNDLEAEKLQESEYQNKIADIIVDCLKEHFIECGKLIKEEYLVIVSNVLK